MKANGKIKMNEADTGNSRKILTLLDVCMEYPAAKLLGDDHYYMFSMVVFMVFST